MAELKTKKNDASVDAFIAGLPDERRRADALALIARMRTITRAEPKMWGGSIVGFGQYRYKYASGREGDWFPVGFSPRKPHLVIYLMGDFAQRAELLATLGKHTSGKGCLYVKSLADVDASVLAELIKRSFKHMTEAHPG